MEVGLLHPPTLERDLESCHSAKTVDNRSLALALSAAEINDRSYVTSDCHVVHGQAPIVINADFSDLCKVPRVAEVKRESETAARG